MSYYLLLVCVCVCVQIINERAEWSNDTRYGDETGCVTWRPSEMANTRANDRRAEWSAAARGAAQREGVIDVLVALFIIGSNAAAAVTQSVFVLFWHETNFFFFLLSLHSVHII